MVTFIVKDRGFRRWHWFVNTPLVTFKGRTITRWGAQRNINRVSKDMQIEWKDESL